MEPAKPPNPIRILCSSLAAWWLADSMNPGFFAVAVMLLLMIPIMAAEIYLVIPEQPASSPAADAKDEDSVQENTA